MHESKLRIELHQLIDQMDDKFLYAVHNLISVYMDKDQVLGYAFDGSEVRSGDFLKQSDQQIKSIKNGESGLSVNEFDRLSKTWLGTSK